MRLNINNENILSIDQIAECFEHALVELEGYYCESDNSRLSIDDVLSMVKGCLRAEIKEMFSDGLQQMEGKSPSALAGAPADFNPTAAIPPWAQQDAK
ncbi:MAG: hypothetical protein JNL20_10245 [Thauera sp.]|nr:hypothetical protein [Thauera sp.]